MSDSLWTLGPKHESFPVHHQLPKLTQIHVHWVGDVIQSSHPLSSHSPPAFNLSQHQGLFHESVLHIRWQKYWSFSFSISPSNEYSGLITFRIDWLDLLAPIVTIVIQIILWNGYNYKLRLSRLSRGKGVLYTRKVNVSCSVMYNSWRPHRL